MLGSEPFCLRRKSSSWVPSEDPAKTTPREVKRRMGPLNQPLGGFGEDLVASGSVSRAVEWPNVDHLGFSEDARALFLGEVEIVFVEGVLGVVAAADHAASASDAGLAIGTFSVEVGIGRGRARLLTFFAEIDGDLGGVEGVGYSCGNGHLFQLQIRGREDGIGDNSHHAFGCLVVRGHHLLPVVEAGPAAMVPDRVARHEHGVGVGNGAATYGVSVQDDHVAEETNIEEAAQTELGLPEVTVEGPVGLGKIFRCPAATHFDDENLVALFCESQRRDAPTETRSDDEVVKVEGRRHGWTSRRPGSVYAEG